MSWHNVFISEVARREILDWPLEVRKDLGSILTKLQKRDLVGPPDVKPMPVITNGCSEIRIRGSDGIYRAFYIIESNLGILLFHCFKKKTQKTPRKEIVTAKLRLENFIKDLANAQKK